MCLPDCLNLYRLSVSRNDQLYHTRVSKTDGRQVHDLQCDALIAAGVDPKRIYQDNISGARDSRPGLID